MTYQKPYTFRAGTYAKSSEVNANFDTLKDFVDDLQEYTEDIQISSAPYNKANRNGSDTEAFKVLAATNSSEAVNLGQMTTAISEAIEEVTNDIFTAPDYSNGTTVTANTTITENGVLVVKGSLGSVGHIELDGTRFELAASNLVTFPVKNGTEVGAISNIYSIKLYTA